MHITLPGMTDSRGHPSKTLTFVTVSWLAVLIRFLLGGLTLGNLGAMPPMSGMDFAAAVGAVLGIWWARERTEKSTSAAQPTPPAGTP